jgi:ubiquinone/menaquinone biosynthesis C-methylase UbiE
MASKVMSAITAKVFNNPRIYRLFTFAVTSRRGKEVVSSALNLDNHKRVLDFGCGLAYYADDFVGDAYLGVDPLESCIKLAKARLSSLDTCEFIVGDETSLTGLKENQYTSCTLGKRSTSNFN